VDILLRAVALAAERLPGISLTIVGHGRDRERLEGLTRVLGLENHVEFHSWLISDTSRSGPPFGLIFGGCQLSVRPV
jgi:glycosyltransferase involved in cell wall biosynthesis